LLDTLIGWARASGFAAVVAKCVPPHRPVMAFMGGQPASVYAARGFELVAAWEDPQLHEALLERGLVGTEDDPRSVAQVGMCVRRF